MKNDNAQAAAIYGATIASIAAFSYAIYTLLDAVGLPFGI
jgi:hypothetical protein